MLVAPERAAKPRVAGANPVRAWKILHNMCEVNMVQLRLPGKNILKILLIQANSTCVYVVSLGWYSAPSIKVRIPCGLFLA